VAEAEIDGRRGEDRVAKVVGPGGVGELKPTENEVQPQMNTDGHR
jgi:hypothetical protein